MNWDSIDWNALERMRRAFLAGTAGAQDYWRNESDVAAYDATFAQRIGWKWDFVLAELRQRGWTPPAAEVWDWGCGSGVAGRAFLDHFGTETTTKLKLFDRSPLATAFAARRASEKFPQLAVETTGLPGDFANGTLLISHVLSELAPEQQQKLADLAATAQCVLWVEPGTYESSLTLIAIREQLRGGFEVVAPCPQQGRCGILAPENERHWCHHFAPSPPEIFTDRGWARFGNETGIDLRDLPVSFLVLDKRPAPELPGGAARLIGRPRIYKGHAQLLGCDRTGVAERRLMQREFPTQFKGFKKGKPASLCQWRCEGNEITSFQKLE